MYFMIHICVYYLSFLNISKSRKSVIQHGKIRKYYSEKICRKKDKASSISDNNQPFWFLCINISTEYLTSSHTLVDICEPRCFVGPGNVSTRRAFKGGGWVYWVSQNLSQICTASVKYRFAVCISRYSTDLR